MYSKLSVVAKSKMKKVTFNEKLNKVHFLVTWNFAYNSSRKGPWIFVAIDRGRFQRRIEELSKIITPILDNNHRCNVYNERFINEM